MSESREKNGSSNLTKEQLAGFVRLLLGGNELPKETPDIVAYLEWVARQSEESGSRIGNVQPRFPNTRTVSDRLKEVCPRPIRPFGIHLLAKRTMASCRLDEVCRLLNEQPDLLRDLETGAVKPLDLEIPRLARISEVFGLCPSELRESLVLDLCEQHDRRGVGTAFARSNEEAFRLEVLQIATNDLRRAASRHRPESRLQDAVLKRVEVIVQAVSDLLKA